MQTIARGIKTPIIKAFDQLDEIVVNAVIKASIDNNFTLNDKDVIAITESVVSISQNNYVTLDEIVIDINNKFPGDTLGVVFPILSRNRFALILKALARAKKKLIVLLSYPYDEVGNPILYVDKLKELKINPYSETITYNEYQKHFANFIHPYTKINMIKYYKEIAENENCEIDFILSNCPKEILKYTKNILVSNIHNRTETKKLIKNNNNICYGLDEILNKPINNSGYNTKYGLLGSNYASSEKLKLFPNESKQLLLNIQNKIYEKTNKKLEVMIYGDGAFKDPSTGIWELADPVVAPSYTNGLIGSPNEVKLKYLVDNEFSNLSGIELENAINEVIKNKDNNLSGKNISLGTTPRQYTDLLGSLADLISGSGDKGTPVVLIQNYF